MYERHGAADERCWGRRRVNEDHLYEGHGIEDGSCWSGGLERAERMCSAVGENSIDFLKILYRLLPDASVQLLGQPGGNDLFVWENRSTLSVENGTKVPRREATFTNEWFRCVGEGTWFCV